jgi:hypothetical protein
MQAAIVLLARTSTVDIAKSAGTRLSFLDMIFS